MMSLYAICVAFVPSITWLALILREDVHSEKRSDILRVFLIGVLSAFPILWISLIGDSLLEFIGLTLPSWLDQLVFGAINEEMIKILLFYLFVIQNPFVDEPIDIFIYSATLALGFAGIENMFLSLTQIHLVGGGLERLLIVRSITAVLVHIISTFFFAYAWQLYRQSRSFLILVQGALISIGFHGLYNYSLTWPLWGDYAIFQYFYILVFVPMFVYMIYLVKKLQKESQ